MGGIVLDSDADGSVAVSARFISNYMVDANGDYVKVYLMLLYYLSDRSRELSLETLGDSLALNEKTVMRALKYWEKMNLLTLKYSSDNVVSAVTVKSLIDSVSDKVRQAATKEVDYSTRTEKQIVAAGKTSEVEVTNACPDKKPDIKRINTDEDFGALLVAVQQYTGTTLSKASVESFAYMYDVLKLPLEVIEYIVEVCVGEGHKSVRYMEAVARDWYGRGIVTLEQAKVQGVVCQKDVYTVMKALGLSGRNPTPKEKSDIVIWLREYGFDLNIVVEACNRNMDKHHRADFKYVEGILKDWKKKGVKHLDDIKKLDAAYKEEQKSKNRLTGTGQTDKRTTVKNNKFHNFEQRDADYEDLKIDINAY